MAGPINWLSQVASITKFGLLGIPAAAGSGGGDGHRHCRASSRCWSACCPLRRGSGRRWRLSGAADAAIVLRSGADSEMVSGLGREWTRVIADAPGVARTAEGPMASAELFVIINLPKRSTGTDANVPLRGVEARRCRCATTCRIVQGRMFESGQE